MAGSTTIIGGTHDHGDRRLDTRSLVFCLLGTFFLRAAAAAGGILIALFLASLEGRGVHIRATLVGLTAVLFYTAELVGSPGFGLLADLQGRKRFMMLGPVFGGAAIQTIVLAPIVPVILVGRLLQGLSAASSVPSTLSFLSSATDIAHSVRGRVMSIFEIVTISGMAAGAAFGGILWDWYGLFALEVTAGLYVVSLLLFALVRDVPHATRRVQGFSEFFAFLRSPSALRLIPAWIAVNAVVGLWFSQIQFQMAKEINPHQLLVGGFTGAEIGLYSAAVSILFVVGIALWSLSFGRLHSTSVMSAALAGLFGLVVVLFFLNSSHRGSSPRIGFLLAAAALLLMVVSGFTPAALTYLAEIAESYPETRGSLMGLYSVFLGVGQFLGAGIGGYFAEWWGVNGMIALTGILGLVAVVFVIDLRRQAEGSLRLNLESS